jgi:G3E family GTPase
MKLPIPCNIVTGALGSGKTTCIQGLLNYKTHSEKNEYEQWAIIVNEFGKVIQQ